MQSNLWKFTVHKTTITRTYMPILAVYLLTLPETTSKTVGIILLVASIGSLIFEVPSGYVSDKMGHRKALLLARLALMFSTSLFLIGASVEWFILGAIFLSLGRAFISGTSSAFMHETLIALKRDKEYAKIVGRMSSLSNAVSIIFIVAIPFLVNFNYRVAFILPLILDIVGFLAVYSLTQPKKTKVQIKEISSSNFISVVRESHRRNMLPYLFIGAWIMIAITAVEDFKEVYLQFLEVPVIYFGIFWAISRAIISIVLLVNDKIKKWLSFEIFLLSKLILVTLLIASLGYFNDSNLVILLTILIAAFNWSFIEAENNYLLDMMKKSNFKATILSFKSLIYEGLVGGAGLLIGYSVTKSGFNNTFYFTSLSLVSLGAILSFWMLSAKRKSYR